MSPDLRRTAELPAIETMADIHRTDPLGVFTHRRPDVDSVSWTDGAGHHSVPYRAPGEWSQAVLNRLLDDVRTP